MREILFRGKRVDNGEWCEGYYVKAEHHWHKHGIHEDWIVCGASANGGWFAIHDRRAVAPYTVGQYTGITDRHGKKIFEGDIVEHYTQDYYLLNRGVVEWAASSASWAMKLNTMQPGFSLYNDRHYKVIGNIHDNPELLEVKYDDQP